MYIYAIFPPLFNAEVILRIMANVNSPEKFEHTIPLTTTNPIGGEAAIEAIQATLGVEN